MSETPRPSALHRWILARPRAVLLGSLVVAAVFALLGTQVEFRTSRSELAPPDDPDQLRWDRLLAEYQAGDHLIGAVERTAPGSDAAEEAAAEAFLDDLAIRLEADPRVERTFHRLDLDWLERRLPYLVPPERLEALADALEVQLGEEPIAPRNFAEVDALLAARLERALAEGGLPAAGGQGDRDPGDGGGAQAVLGALGGYLDFRAKLLADPEAARADWGRAGRLIEALPGALPAPRGYQRTRDGALHLIVIVPADKADDLPERRALVGAVRAHAEAARQATAGADGLRFLLTGQPAMVVEEMDTVKSDTLFTSIVALLGVTVLTVFVFRWRTHALLVLGALLLGLVVSFGAVTLELGYLNLITSSFLSTLIGVGVAYGIHPVSEYELEGAHLVDPERALSGALARTSDAVAVAAVTTSAAFFSILFMRFKGFAELGLVAGFGVLFCLAAALVTLPAMVLLYGRRRARRDRRRRGGSAVDRVWVERAASHVVRAPAPVVGVALAITALAAWGATGLRFDTNLLKLLPRDAESLSLQLRLAETSDFTPLFNVVRADDLESLRAMRERAAEEPTIARFRSALDFLPEDPARSRRAAGRLAALLQRVDPQPWRAPAPGEAREALERLEWALADAADQAFGAGLGETAAALEEARARAETALDAASAEAAPAAASIWEGVRERRRALLESLALPPPEADDLPPSLLRRFVTRTGGWLGFLYPAGDLFDPDTLDAFSEASRRVSAEATGFPIVFRQMSGRIVAGFERAVLFGAAIVLALLILDLRSLRDALFAAAPLAMGATWMLGAMRLLDLDFNFANLVGVPLIVGVGIDNGVHILRRVRLEGEQGMSAVLRHTGRAILIASLTTMIGFGSLALAAHRGIASLGLVLLVGVAGCLVTSTVVLPNLLVLLRRVGR